MRKLNSSDIFVALRLIKRANLKAELKPVMELAASGELTVKDIGIEGILTSLEIISEKKSEEALYEALSGPFEINPEEVKTMELDKLVENLKTLAEQNNIKRFFSLLSGLLSKK